MAKYEQASELMIKELEWNDAYYKDEDIIQCASKGHNCLYFIEYEGGDIRITKIIDPYGVHTDPVRLPFTPSDEYDKIEQAKERCQVNFNKDLVLAYGASRVLDDVD